MKDTRQKVYNSFEEALKDNNLQSLLESMPFQKHLPMNARPAAEAVVRAITAKKKILIDPDCDIDGFMAGAVAQNAMIRINYTNYDIVKHAKKRHTLTPAHLTSIVEDNYGLVILLDSSTNDMSGLQYLSDHDIDVVVMDHHSTDFAFKDYPKNVYIVNPKIDKIFSTIPYEALSGCAVTAVMFDYILSKYYNISNNRMLYVYAYFTLYSDSCDLSCPMNRAIIEEFRDTTDLPGIILMFMDRYKTFNRNFVTWFLAPRLNALMRMEKFDFVYDLFYNNETLLSQPEVTKATIEEVYLSARHIVSALIDSSLKTEEVFDSRGNAVAKYPITVLDNIAFMTIPLEGYDAYRNFSGTIASSLATRFKKTGSCLLYRSMDMLEGSVRDCDSREILPVFQEFCYAEGHAPAFGVEMPANQYRNILALIDTKSDTFTESRGFLVVDWNATEDQDANTVSAESYEMAKYNEISGGVLPVAHAVVWLTDEFKYKVAAKYSKASVGHIEFISFDGPLASGMQVLVAPSFSGGKVSMVVQAVLEKVQAHSNI